MLTTRFGVLLLVVLSASTPAFAGPSEQRIPESESPISVDYPGLDALKSFFGHGTMDDLYTWERATWASFERRISVMYATAKPWGGFNQTISIDQEIRGLKVFHEARRLSFQESWRQPTRLGEAQAASFEAAYGNGRWQCAALLVSKTQERLTAYVCETREEPLDRSTLQRLLSGTAIKGVADTLAQ